MTPFPSTIRLFNHSVKLAGFVSLYSVDEDTEPVWWQNLPNSTCLVPLSRWDRILGLWTLSDPLDLPEIISSVDTIKNIYMWKTRLGFVSRHMKFMNSPKRTSRKLLWSHKSPGYLAVPSLAPHWRYSKETAPSLGRFEEQQGLLVHSPQKPAWSGYFETAWLRVLLLLLFH